MKTYDQWTSLFWLVLSVVVCIESLRLGIGTIRNPGMGFMPFGTSGLLGILSVCLFVQTIVRKDRSEIKSIFLGTLWKRVILVLIALLIYSRLLPLTGYLISTFLVMSFLFWIVKGQRWWWVVFSSILSTISTYYFFSKWLGCQFPEGPFGF